MRPGFLIFRVALAAMWLAVLIVTIRAVAAMGTGAAGDFFFGDMAHPWRAQFNIDFGFHLLLVAAWLLWRTPNRLLGLLFAALAIIMGGLFTVAYLFALTFAHDGDLRRVLVGPRGASPEK